MAYAHYTNSSKRTGDSATVRLTHDIAGRDVIATLAVIGKREALAVAAKHNATPWNF